MSNNQNKEPLLPEFPPVSKEKWEKVIEQDLQGADYRKKLKWNTGEGIEALPFYCREDIEASRSLSPGKHKRWTICAPVFDQSVEEANESACKALERGANALQFHIQIHSTSGALGGDVQGTAVQDQESFHRLLKNIDLERISLSFDAGMATPLVAAMLLNHLDEHPVQEGEGAGASFSYDPFVYVAQKGKLPKRRPLLEKEITQLAENSKNSPLSRLKPLCADGRFWHNAGGMIVHELSFSLAAASEYLALLTDKGVTPRDAAGSINFHMAVGSKYFPEIAKLRALRLLWRQLLAAYGIDIDNDIPAYIQAETSIWNKTLYDPYVNMLRTTTEGMAAAIAGADALCVNPFDSVFKEPDEFSGRIARNSQIIMQEEAYLHKVADPGAGSYYIEKLTNTFAEEAWNLFQEIEQEGGLLASLKNGTVQSAVREAQQQRDREIATRGRVFVGTNQYPNPDESAETAASAFSVASLVNTDYDFNLDEDGSFLMTSIRQAFREGAALGDLVPKLFQEDWSKHAFRIISPYRGSQPFEELRLATEKQERTPLVLTLPMGDRRMRKARSSFTTNFFGCAGYEIRDPIGFEKFEEAFEAIQREKPDIVVLCSSDKEYEELVPPLAEQVKKMENKPIIVMAGYPKDRIDHFRKAGVDSFIHSGCNVLETLTDFHLKLGIMNNQD